MIELTKSLTFTKVEPLTNTERTELTECETTVAAGRKHFILIGKALLKIRDQALYRATHKTFEHYLREKWDMSREYGYKSIEAAKTVETLTQMLPNVHILPDNEAQARALSGLAPELQQQVWQKAVTTSDGKPTARIVKDVAQEFKPMPSLSNKPGDKRHVPATPSMVNFAEGRQEEAGADYWALWQAEKERGDKLQDRVRALEAEVARLQSGSKDLEAEVVDIASATEEKLAGGDTTISLAEDVSCPVCSAPDWSQCDCDADVVNGLLLERRLIAA